MEKMISGPPEEGPKRAGRTAIEGLAKSSPCEVGMQVSCGDHSEVPQESALRQDTGASGSNTSGTVSGAWNRPFGRQGDARSCAHVAQRSTKIQHSPYDWISEGQERPSNPSQRGENKWDFVRPQLLVQRLLCGHRRLGRTRNSTIHQEPRKTPETARTVGVGS